MTVEDGMSGSETTVVRIAALLGDAQRALADAERLLTAAEQARTSLQASDLAARQAAIVDAAHAEAAVILAKAHADAARVLEAAAAGQRPVAEPVAPVVPRDEVVDLRVQDSAPPPPTDERGAESPAAGSSDSLDAEMRASIAAAADMARRVSGRIERLSQDLHQAPAS